MTDAELVQLALDGDKNAERELLERYTPLVKSVAARIFLFGGEREDLVQEGMVGLCSAIHSYDAGYGANFSTYAYACVRNAVADYVKKLRGAKYSALNDFVPILEIDDNLSSVDPEDEMIRHENRREFLQKISKCLSSYEFKATVMYIDGMGAAEIGEALGKSAKSVDNALTRAKNKLIKLYTV